MVEITKHILSNYKFKILFLYVLVMINTFLAPLIVLLNGSLVDALIYSSTFDINIIIVEIIFLLILIIISSIFQYYDAIRREKLVIEVSDELISQQIIKFHDITITDYVKINKPIIANNIVYDSEQISNFIITKFLKFFTSIFLLVFYVTFLLINNRPIFIFLLLSLSIVLIRYINSMKTIKNISITNLKETSNYFTFIHDFISNIKFIQLRGLASESYELHRVKYKNYANSKIHIAKSYEKMSDVDTVIRNITNVLLLVICAIEITFGRITIGEYFVVSSYFYNSLGGITELIGFLRSFAEMKPIFNRYSEIQNFRVYDCGEIKMKIINEISVSNLNFSFEDDANLYNGFSYSFFKNQLYTIIGNNGCGKSTLLDLLCGFYDCEDAIKLNGVSIGKLDMKEIRNKCFRTNVEDTNDFNYKIARVDEDVIRSYGPKTNNMIEKFKVDLKGKNYNTFSIGEHCKYKLVSMLQKDASIFLVDEPTNGLDEYSVNLVLGAFHELKLGRILIVVSHDEDIILNSDKVVKLDLIGL